MKKKVSLNQKWQVSFSDLLTILLCFFVALIAHGSFKQMKSGTAFAEPSLNKNDSVFKEVLLSPKDIEQGELLKALATIKNDINLGSYAKKEIGLSSCGNQDIETAKANLTQLERQIADMHLSNHRLSFEIGRAGCSKKSLEKEVVAKVSINLKN